MFKLYEWFLPKHTTFIGKYVGNLRDMAEALWDEISSASGSFFVVCVIVAIVFASIYYYAYNRLPGRKYRVVHWFVFLAIQSVIVFLVTLVMAAIMVTGGINEKTAFLFRISALNASYAAVVYWAASVLICNLPIPTNAYRFLKFKSEK